MFKDNKDFEFPETENEKALRELGEARDNLSRALLETAPGKFVKWIVEKLNDFLNSI